MATLCCVTQHENKGLIYHYLSANIVSDREEPFICWCRTSSDGVSAVTSEKSTPGGEGIVKAFDTERLGDGLHQLCYSVYSMQLADVVIFMNLYV